MFVVLMFSKIKSYKWRETLELMFLFSPIIVSDY